MSNTIKVRARRCFICEHEWESLVRYMDYMGSVDPKVENPESCPKCHRNTVRSGPIKEVEKWKK